MGWGVCIMKVTAIMYSTNRYYYKENRTGLTTVRNPKVNVERIVIDEIEENDNREYALKNSAEYVKQAYEMSFRPLDLIMNLQLE